MRILYQNRPRNQWVGGDQIKLDKIMGELLKMGYDVTFNDQPVFTPALLVQMYDIIHVWNFSMEWTKYQVWVAKRHHRKLVCSMTYHEMDKYISWENQQIMLDALDMAIYETPGEIEKVKHHMKVNKSKSVIIPNGVDAWWFKPEKGNVPIDNYALTVGRIEPSKGQLEACIAAKKLKMNFVAIGEVTDYPYSEQIKELGGIIYPSMDQKDLKRWYKNAKVYAQVSKSETWGMAIDEAGTQGTPLVLSTSIERKDIPDAVYCEYANVKSIRDAIQKARGIKSDKFKNLLKKRTWKKVAQEYIKIYKKLMK